MHHRFIKIRKVEAGAHKIARKARAFFSENRRIVLASVFVFLVVAGVLWSAGFGFRDSMSSVASDVSWTENAGAGVMVPACSSASPGMTCSGGQPLVTFTWADLNTGPGDTLYINYPDVIWSGHPTNGSLTVPPGVLANNTSSYTYRNQDFTTVYNDNTPFTTPNCAPLTASCSVSQTSANIGQNVTWSATASGGVLPASECTNSTGKATCVFDEAAAPPSVTITWTAGGSGNTSYVCIWDPSFQTFMTSDCYGTRGGNLPGTANFNTFSDINGVPLEIGKTYSYRVNATNCPTPGGTGCGGDNLIDEGSFPVVAGYTYSWSGTDGLSGTTQEVLKSYSSPGNKTGSVTVSAGSQSDTKTCSNSVVVSGSSLLATTLSVNPSSGTAPLNGVDLTATVSGSVTGAINYTFYCNRSDAGVNVTSGYDAKFDNTNENPKTVLDVCNYPSPGTYSAKVIVERGVQAVEDRATIKVNSAVGGGPPPIVTVLANNTSGTIFLSAPASYIVTWDTANADSCTATGSWSGAKSLPGGSQVFSNVGTGVYNYGIFCTGPGGSSFGSVGVNVSLIHEVLP